MRLPQPLILLTLVLGASAALQPGGDAATNVLGPRRLDTSSFSVTAMSNLRPRWKKKKHHGHPGHKDKHQGHSGHHEGDGNKNKNGGGGGGGAAAAGAGVAVSVGGDVKSDGKLTWYDGDQLNAPACGDATPSRDDLIVAVKQDGPFRCHDKLRIFANGKSVDVKVVDMCASCEPTHIDAAPGVWAHLGLSLDIGVVDNLKYQKL